MISLKAVISVVLVISLTVDAQRCNGGAQCIPLQSCSGLYQQLVQGNTPQLTRLLRSLHCGFESQDPKVQDNINKKGVAICCPPQFLNSNTQRQSNQDADANSLLPTMKECGQQFRDKIVGGIEADLDEHRWMALLWYDKPNGWGFYCGGVLISRRYVLTAAHCIKGQGLPPTWKLSKVRLGEWNTKTAQDCTPDFCSDPPVDVPIEEIIVHEGYSASDDNQWNDIALLRLSRNVSYTDYIQPICLPSSSALRTSTFDGVTAEVAGWGKTETSSESDIKLKVAVPIVNNNDCANTFAGAGRSISNKQLCAGGQAGRDSCRGDSGGSLMAQQLPQQNWVAIGVVSYGPSPCGTPGWPGVYTRVGAYIDWILSKLRP